MLAAAAHRVRLLPVGQPGPGAHDDALRDALRDADALVVVGGDGTIHSAADAIIDAGTPVYHFPVGTENLFAREFGMDRAPRTLLDALRARRVVRVDAARANARRFLLMCGVGPDARVVHRVARARRRALGHAMYVLPVLAELLAPGPAARVSVTVDGERAVDRQPGALLVANSRQYGARLDPARRASPCDGLLDAVFLPAAGSLGVMRWAALSRLGWHLDRAGLVYRTGRRIRVECDDPQRRCQIDGEASRLAEGTGGSGVLDIEVEPGVFPVLVPPGLARFG